MLSVRIFLISFSLLLSSVVFAQKSTTLPAKDAPQTELSTNKKSSVDRKAVENRNQAFQEYSNNLKTLMQKEQPAKVTLQRLERMTTDLYAEHPGHRFPAVLLDGSGKQLSLKKQADMYERFLPELAGNKGNSAAESGGFTGFTIDQEACLIEYFSYGITQDIPSVVAGMTFVLMVPEHQAYMQNVFNQQSVCNSSHAFIADWNHNIMQY